MIFNEGIKLSLYFLFEIKRKQKTPMIEKDPVITRRNNNEALIATSFEIPLATNIPMNPPSQIPVPAGIIDTTAIKDDMLKIAVSNIKSKSEWRDFKIKKIPSESIR